MEDEIVVSVEKLADKMELSLLTPEINIKERFIRYFDVNRPALQLTGFYQHFDDTRVQILGNVEQQYMATMKEGEAAEAFKKLTSYDVPCIIFTRGYTPADDILAACRGNGVPCFTTPKFTSDLSSEIIRWLKVELAPRMSIHGVLVDVYGEGVLITGDSGVGKSEAALELVNRGHRLVSDDVVELRRVSDETIIGSAPEMIKNFIELRGIGIINVRTLFGFEAIKETQQIDMVIQLEDPKKDKEYDRLGLNENYTELLGKKVICHEIPIRPGRNVAIIVECAAVNNRAKKMGHNAPQELFERISKKSGSYNTAMI